MKRSQVMIIIAIAIPLLGLLVSYFISTSTMNKYSDKLQSVEHRIDSVRSKCLSPTGVVPGVRYEALVDYVNNAKQEEPTVPLQYSIRCRMPRWIMS